MPAPPVKADILPAGSLSPADYKTEFEKFFDYAVALLGASGNAADALTALGAAADSAAVKLTGNQTIAGVKTFSSSPVMPGNATTNLQAVPKQQLDAAVAPANLAPTLFVPATAVELSSGSSATLSSSVPSWARKLTIVVDRMSSSSTGNYVVTLNGETTGYSGLLAVGSGTTTSLSTGFVITDGSVAAAEWNGVLELYRVVSSGNSYWQARSELGRNDAGALPSKMIGAKQLSGDLTTVSLSVSSGTFDGGRAQLFWS